jgi:hypothetical protein
VGVYARAALPKDRVSYDVDPVATSIDFAHLLNFLTGYIHIHSSLQCVSYPCSLMIIFYASLDIPMRIHIAFAFCSAELMQIVCFECT